MVKWSLILVLVSVVLVVTLSGCKSMKQSNSTVNDNYFVQKQHDEAVRNQIELNSKIHQQGIDALTK